MSWKITKDGEATLVALESDLGIQDAASFHQAVLPFASSEGAVRLNASATKSIHTSIMQILYALSQAAPGFVVTAASEDFRATEARMGLFFVRTKEAQTLTNQSGPT